MVIIANKTARTWKSDLDELISLFFFYFSQTFVKHQIIHSKRCVCAGKKKRLDETHRFLSTHSNWPPSKLSILFGIEMLFSSIFRWISSKRKKSFKVISFDGRFLSTGLSDVHKCFVFNSDKEICFFFVQKRPHSASMTTAYQFVSPVKMCSRRVVLFISFHFAHIFLCSTISTLPYWFQCCDKTNNATCLSSACAIRKYNGFINYEQS